MVKKELVLIISTITTIISLVSSFIVFLRNEEWYSFLLTFVLFVLLVISGIVGIISGVLSIKENTEHKSLDLGLLIVNIIIVSFEVLIFILVFIGILYTVTHGGV